MAIRTRPAADRLLEREAELAALEATLIEARDGAGRLALVEGPPGIGKSALVHAAGDRAAALGLRVLRARGAELERATPFGAVLQLFGDAIDALPAAAREAVLSGPAARAAPLLAPDRAAPADDRAGRPATADDPVGQDVHALIHGLLWVATGLADHAPLAICVDDAHWVDEASLRWLIYIGWRLRDLPVAVIVAARPSEPGSQRALLETLRGNPDVTLVQPAPLSTAAVGQIVERHAPARPDDEFVRACAETTGGNPFLLREVLVAVDELHLEPTAASVAQVRAIAPEPVARAVTLTLGRLDPDARAVARSLAVLGDGAPSTRVAALADVPLERVGTAAVELAEAGLLVDGAALAFAHPVLRSAVEDGLPAEERSAAHLAAARLLRDAGADAQAIAAHLREMQPPPPEPWARDVLRRAAAAALAFGAPHDAEALLRVALTATPDADPERAVVEADLARARAAAGDPDAPELLAAVATRITDPDAQADVLGDVGRLRFAQGRFAEARDAFDAAAELASGERAASLRVGAAAARIWVPTDGPTPFERAGIHRLGHEAERTHAGRSLLANLAGTMAIGNQDRETAVALARRGWADGALLQPAGAEEPALPAITATFNMAEQFAEGVAICDAAMADARRRGSVLAFATASYLRGAMVAAAGRPREAADDLERAVAARRDGWSLYLAAAWHLLALARLDLGDVAGAEALTAEAAEADPALHAAAPWLTRQTQGQLALHRGDPEAAAELFASCREPLEAFGGVNPNFFSWRPGLTLSLNALGRCDEARALAVDHVRIAREWGAPRAIAEALRLQAATHDDAAPLREALDVLEGSPSELERTLVWIDLGARLSRDGDPVAAREPLRRALDAAAGLGAAGVAQRAREELVAAGGRPRRARLSGLEALTPAELRVARLAADGHTNREVAAALFVTLKAVEYHLSNVYTKLGTRSRADLPADLPGAT